MRLNLRLRRTLVPFQVCGLVVLLFGVLAGCRREPAAPPITFRDLVAGLANATQIACLDAPAGHLISSFDPTGGNDDFNHPLRQGPEGWVVLADLKGPGYVSRFWMTGAEDGTWPVRFFFDGEKTPRIDTTLDEWCGKKAPFLSPLAAYDPFCWYSFVPVPYRKHLVIMTKAGGYKNDGWPRLFYQISYCDVGSQKAEDRGKAWMVESYPKTLAPQDVAALERVRATLMRYNDPLSRMTAGEDGGWRADSGGSSNFVAAGTDRGGLGAMIPAAAEVPVALVSGRIDIASGRRASFDLIAGPAIIQRLEFIPDLSGLANALAREQAMRNLILRIYWDDAAQPCVEVPFGDFFGSVWRPRQFESFYFGMTGGVYYARWPMPFRKSARIEIENLTAAAVGVQGSVFGVRFPVVGRGEAGQPGSAPSATAEQPACYLQPTAHSLQPDMGYFHAAWRKSTANDVGRPHSILQARGRGRYVGCILSATSFDKSWWLLEGDESMHVDGESAPSWHGTGLEDYFNGGWYYGSAIVRPFNGLPMKAHFRTIQYRIHHADPVVFTSSISVGLERGPDNASHGTYESVAFYYMAAPAGANAGLGDAGFRQPPADPLRQVAIMTELNDLEKIGDFDGASDTIATFLEQFPNYPYAPVLRLREILYGERTRGIDVVKAEVLAFLRRAESRGPGGEEGQSSSVAAGDNRGKPRLATPATEEKSDPAMTLARRQAEDWLWFQSDPTNGLLFAYCNTPTHLYMDGQFIGESGDPQRMQVFRVSLSAGRHALALKVRQREYPYWVLACLRTHKGDLACTSPSWRNAYAPVGTWAAADFDDSTWKRVGGTDRGKGPPEEPYLWLEPNAFPGVQSVAKGIWVSAEWPDRNRPVVLRTGFEVR